MAFAETQVLLWSQWVSPPVSPNIRVTVRADSQTGSALTFEVGRSDDISDSLGRCLGGLLAPWRTRSAFSNVNCSVASLNVRTSAEATGVSSMLAYVGDMFARRLAYRVRRVLLATRLPSSLGAHESTQFRLPKRTWSLKSAAMD